MKLFKTVFLSLLLTLGFSLPATAGVALIVNKDNANSLTANQVRKIYLGKTKAFPNGEEVIPLDLPSGDATRADFLKKVVKKDESALNSYWARMLFSSKGKPPKVLDDAASVKEIVANNPNTLGYIDSADVDDTVKVILELP